MKKILLSVCLLIGINQVNAEFTINDIINDNTRLTDKQRMEEIKKIPEKDRLDLVNNLQQPFKNVNQADKFISILYNIPKDAFNDKDSMETFMDNLYASIVQNDGKADFYKQRTEKESFNIYYEAQMLHFSSPKSTGFLSYPEYDKFYSKLLGGTLDFKKESDRQFFFGLNKQMNVSMDFNDDDNNEAENKENLAKIQVLNKYIHRNEFKNYKIKNKYHIYLLGMVIFEKYNDNTADFISRKINDPKTNLENLCYFLDSLELKNSISPIVEKEFDEGFYNPQTDPFKIWRDEQFIDVSDIDGSENLIVQAINNCNIDISPAQRLQIIQMDDYFYPDFNNYRQLSIEKINKIGKNKKIKDKNSAIMEVLNNYYTIAKKEADERTRKDEERLEELDEQFSQFINKIPY